MPTKEGHLDSGYDATYFFGKTIVHIVAPKLKTPEEIDSILEEHHEIGWEIWKEILEREESNKENK